ncbi:MAG: nickel-dependent lactate racemase [Chloroflexi bacterium]|nr:nickel-dependent lactate racemase [Chloroflexota bacterium]
MLVDLAYGKDGLGVELPDENVTVIEPLFHPGLPREDEAIRQAIRKPIGSPPLRDLVSSDDSVVVVFSDKTRPMPNKRVLPVLLAELDHLPADQILLINATGMHRANTEQELAEMLGEGILSRYRIINHDAFDHSGLTYLGTTSFGNEAWVNSQFLKAKVKILTGFIEPHFFAGFSGGPKSILPGVSGEQTVLRNHGGPMIGHPKATWGITDGNPIYKEACEIADMTKPDFILNVTLNRLHQITGVFAGELHAAHRSGTDFARRTAMQQAPHAYDIVITTNSGYPLDLNLYQTMKGVSAAAQITRAGGAIIVASECSEGVPEYGNYKKILKMARTPEEILEIVSAPDFGMFDQWEAHVQALIQLKARVYLKCASLSEAETREALLEPCTCVEETLALLLREYGAQAKIAVLPQGPQTIPYVAS